ncbi:MAG: NAD-dependent epimerase/dehydratase family protein [Candidatus Limnocylindrales bacterium]
MSSRDAALNGRRVLVTGGAGVIARELLAQLAEAGSEILSVDRLPLPMTAPRGVRHVIGDLAEMDLAELEHFRPEHIFHLAATFERPVESPEFWAQNWSDNVIVTHRLAELGERARVTGSFVFASSYLVYDPAQYAFPDPPSHSTALSEVAVIRPRNLCGAAKLYGEAEASFVHGVRRAPYRAVFARIFRVYGRGSRDIVSRWVRAALGGQPIDVYHPENRFDYVFSGDVAEGLLRMAATKAAVGPINLASGRSRPVGEVIAAIERATGRHLDRSDHPVDELYEASQADLTRLEDVLGWRPPTTLEAGVERLVAFERVQASTRAERPAGA